jgi:hypothetical protein
MVAPLGFAIICSYLCFSFRSPWVQISADTSAIPVQFRGFPQLLQADAKTIILNMPRRFTLTNISDKLFLRSGDNSVEIATD